VSSKTSIGYHSIVINKPVNINDNNFDTYLAMYMGELRCLWGYWLFDSGEYYINYSQRGRVIFLMKLEFDNE